MLHAYHLEKISQYFQEKQGSKLEYTDLLLSLMDPLYEEMYDTVKKENKKVVLDFYKKVTHSLQSKYDKEFPNEKNSKSTNPENSNKSDKTSKDSENQETEKLLLTLKNDNQVLRKKNQELINQKTKLESTYSSKQMFFICIIFTQIIFIILIIVFYKYRYRNVSYKILK
ncbi:hypothetical protein AB837_00122 [bacterium AB1]|nr:hypothetical protein AB837_00122 [bacterium AB1]